MANTVLVSLHTLYSEHVSAGFRVSVRMLRCYVGTSSGTRYALCTASWPSTSVAPDHGCLFKAQEQTFPSKNKLLVNNYKLHSTPEPAQYQCPPVTSISSSVSI